MPAWFQRLDEILSDLRAIESTQRCRKRTEQPEGLI